MTQRIATFAAALALVGALFVGVPSVARASATTWYLSAATHASGGSCADPDYTVDGVDDDVQVQSAFDAAADGDTVHFCAGTFYFAREVVWSVGDGVNVEGDGVAATILDGQDETRLFSSKGNLAIASMTLQNGNSDSEHTCMDGYYDGGAVCVDGVLTLHATLFQHNVSGDWAGAAAAGEVHIFDSVFRDNHARNDTRPGGAIATEDLKYAHSTVSSSEFDGNYGQGGAIFATNSDTLSVAGSRFLNNVASDTGGAILAYSLNLELTTFTNNHAGNVGGAVYTRSGVLAGSQFVDNSAGQNGGAIYADQNVTATNSVFTNNQSHDRGGAIAARSYAGSRSRFADNTAGTTGGALFIWRPTADSMLEIRSNIFMRNLASIGGGAVALDLFCVSHLGVARIRSRLARFTSLNRFSSNRATQLRRWSDLYYYSDGFCD